MSDSIIFRVFLHTHVSLKMSLCLNVYFVLLIGTVVLPFPLQSFCFKVAEGISIKDVMFPNQQALLLYSGGFCFGLCVLYFVVFNSIYVNSYPLLSIRYKISRKD